MLSQHDRFAAIKYIGILTVMLLLVTLSGCTPHNIEVTQPVAVNPPGTQHKITAIVTDAEGRPVSHSRVDWILPRSERGVGDIVDTGDDRKTNPGAKKTNTYAKTRTDFDGKATITITSPQQGKTSIIAIAKGIQDPEEHKEHAVKYWIDLKWKFPNNDINQVGTPHRMKARLFKGNAPPPDHLTEPVRHDDLRNYRIEWEILTDFQVTDSALDLLRKNGVVEGVIDALAALKRREPITGKREFLSLLAAQLKRVLTEEEKALIWKFTKVINENEPDAYFEQNGSDLLTTRTPSHGESQVT
ncbi:Ig-like domain-containing protein, partial [Candidatus Entotheonella palauensis]|uniref:Ig-like domain-containing protein n=1 Tax=Candidatus Entotheonella palauensis TaxID=93172 RepID=UPI001177A82D